MPLSLLAKRFKNWGTLSVGNCIHGLMTFLPSQISGHVKVEVDIEITDNDKRAHRRCFYVNCELGQIERFGKMLKSIVTDEKGTVISLTWLSE